MAKYKDKWKTTFPTSIGNQTRPEDGVDNTQEYNTDGLPQYMANDPVRYDLQNAVNSQLVSNDERLNEKIKRTSDDLAAHNKDPKAHATGIAGNAATASKLLTPRTISLTGKATGSASFDGSANANINVTSVNADTASKLSTARKINITGNATGAANFDGSGDISINTTVNESKHAAAATTVNATAPNGGAADLVFGIMANNDSARIRVGGSTDNGWLEIATSDNGNEPIYARQYSGGFRQDDAKSITNEAVLLDGNGDTKFPKNVTAASFTGPLNGNAATATTAGSARLISPFEIATANVFRNVWFSDSDTSNKACYSPNIQYNPATNVLKVGTVQGTATNADTVDGVHAGSMYYNKGDWAADNWATMGTYQVNNNAPNANWYGWGQVISSSTNDARFQLYASHQYGGDGRLHYRTGWYNDKGQPWNTILDSENYNKFATQTISKIYPVGSIYMSMSATNPATLFGVGTWARISQGRMLLGADDSGYKAGATGGEATHTLSVNEMPAHSHGISNSGDHTHFVYGSDDRNGAGYAGDGIDTGGNGHFGDRNNRYTTSSAGAHTHTIDNAGGGAAHNNMPPYLVCYIWQRTA